MPKEGSVVRGSIRSAVRAPAENGLSRGSVGG